MKSRIKRSHKLLTLLLGFVCFVGPIKLIRAEPTIKIKVIAFDAFVVFDPRPLSALAEKLFPDKGADLLAAWRTRQFEYTWLRTISGTYEDFWKVTGDALVYAAKAQKLGLPVDKKTN